MLSQGGLSMKTSNVYALLLDMVKFEQNFGAYWIYLALKRGYLQKHDPIDRIYDVPFTEDEIAEIGEMNRRDVLGINRIKLYVTRMEDNKYAFYFAQTPYEAQELHSKIYGYTASKWHSVYNQHRYTTIYDLKHEEYLLFCDLKDRVKVFPYYVGELMEE